MSTNDEPGSDKHFRAMALAIAAMGSLPIFSATVRKVRKRPRRGRLYTTRKPVFTIGYRGWPRRMR